MTYVIVGLGEILWDMLPEGKQLGGAPANFAYHTKALDFDNVEAYIISCIGHDALGAEIQSRLDTLQINQQYLSINQQFKTGTVIVSLDKQGLPDYNITENVAWDYIPEIQNQHLPAIDVVCFGSLALRSSMSKRSIINFLSDLPAGTLKIFDINLRQSFFDQDIIEKLLTLANILKINDDELKVISQLLNISGNEQIILKTFSERYQIKLIILTRGSSGSVLYANGKFYTHPGYKIDSKDTVGAGDAYTAAIALGMLKGFDLDKLNHCANQLASYVCTKQGATPELPDKLISLFH